MEQSNNDYSQSGSRISVWLASLTGYKKWLSEQDLSAHSRRAYWSKVQRFIIFCADSNLICEQTLTDSHSFELTARAYRDFLKHSLKAGPSSINNSLIAIEHFCSFLGIKSAKIERERRRRWAVRTLTAQEQEMYLQSARQQEWARDTALALVVFSAGLRISECSNLNIDDVSIAGDSCRLLVRCSGASGHVRIKEKALLNAETKQALKNWIVERGKLVGDRSEPALWIGQHGRRLSAAGIDFVIRRIGWRAHVVVSVETLRQTSLSIMARSSAMRSFSALSKVTGSDC